MTKLLFAILLAFTPAFAQDKTPPAPAPKAIEAAAKPAAKAEEDKTPALTDNDKLKVQLMFTQRELIVSKFNAAKAQYEKDAQDLDTAYQKASKDLSDAVDAAYSQAKADKSKFDFDMSKAEFVKHEDKPSAPAAAPPAK